MDGCSAWRIEVPLVRPALVMTTVFSIVATPQLYNEPAILRSFAPHASSTYTPICAAYGQIDAFRSA